MQSGKLLRCLLMLLHVWDPSLHGLLSLKQMLSAFRMQPPDASLYAAPSEAQPGEGKFRRSRALGC